MQQKGPREVTFMQKYYLLMQSKAKQGIARNNQRMEEEFEEEEIQEEAQDLNSQAMRQLRALYAEDKERKEEKEDVRNEWVGLASNVDERFDYLLGNIKGTLDRIRLKEDEQQQKEKEKEKEKERQREREREKEEEDENEDNIDEQDSQKLTGEEDEEEFMAEHNEDFYDYEPHHDTMNPIQHEQEDETYSADINYFLAFDPMKKYLGKKAKMTRHLRLNQDFSFNGQHNPQTHIQFHNHVHPNTLIVEKNIGRYLTNFAVQLKLDLVDDFDNDQVNIDGQRCTYQQVPKQLNKIINDYEDLFKLHHFKTADLINRDNELERLTKEQKLIIAAASRDLEQIEQEFQQQNKDIQLDDINSSSNSEQEIEYFKKLIPTENLSNQHKLQIIHQVLQGYNTGKVRMAVPDMRRDKNKQGIKEEIEEENEDKDRNMDQDKDDDQDDEDDYEDEDEFEDEDEDEEKEKDQDEDQDEDQDQDEEEVEVYHEDENVNEDEDENYNDKIFKEYLGSQEENSDFKTNNSYSDLTMKGSISDTSEQSSYLDYSHDSRLQDFIYDELNGENAQKQKRTLFIKPEQLKKQILKQNQKNRWSKKQSIQEKCQQKFSLAQEDGKVKLLLDSVVLIEQDNEPKVEEEIEQSEFKKYKVRHDYSGDYFLNLQAQKQNAKIQEQQLKEQSQQKNESQDQKKYQSQTQEQLKLPKESSQKQREDQLDSQLSESSIEEELIQIPEQGWNSDNVEIYNELEKRGVQVEEDIDDAESSLSQKQTDNVYMELQLRKRLDPEQTKQLDDLIKEIIGEEEDDDENLKRILNEEYLKKEIEKQNDEEMEIQADQDSEKVFFYGTNNDGDQKLDLAFINQFRIKGTNNIDFANMNDYQIMRYYKIIKKYSNLDDGDSDLMQLLKYNKYKEIKEGEKKELDSDEADKQELDKLKQKLKKQIEKSKSKSKYLQIFDRSENQEDFEKVLKDLGKMDVESDIDENQRNQLVMLQRKHDQILKFEEALNEKNDNVDDVNVDDVEDLEDFEDADNDNVGQNYDSDKSNYSEVNQFRDEVRKFYEIDNDDGMNQDGQINDDGQIDEEGQIDDAGENDNNLEDQNENDQEAVKEVQSGKFQMDEETEKEVTEDDDDEKKFLDKLDETHKNQKYLRMILENGLYSDLFYFEGSDPNELGQKKFDGADLEGVEGVEDKKDQNECNQEYDLQVSQKIEDFGKLSALSKESQFSQQMEEIFEDNDEVDDDDDDELNNLLTEKEDIDIEEFHKDFVPMAERYNEISVDNEVISDESFEDINQEQFQEEIDKEQLEEEKKEKEEQAKALKEKQIREKAMQIEAEDFLCIKYKNDEDDEEPLSEESFTALRNHPQFKKWRFDFVERKKSAFTQEDKKIKNIDIGKNYKQYVDSEDILFPLMSVICHNYPTNSLCQILQDSDLKFVQPFLKTKIYKRRFNESSYDINTNPLSQVDISPVFEAFKLYKQPKIYNVIHNRTPEDIAREEQQKELRDEKVRKEWKEREQRQKIIDQEQFQMEKDQIFADMIAQVDPKCLEGDESFDSYGRVKGKKEDASLDQYGNKKLKFKIDFSLVDQFEKEEQMEIEDESSNQFIQGNISMGSIQSDNPLIKIMQQQTGTMQVEEDLNYESSQQYSQDEGKLSQKDRKSKTNTISQKLGLDKNPDQKIIIQPQIVFRIDEQQFDRNTALEVGLYQQQIEEVNDNYEQKFLKQPDQEDDFKVDEFRDQFTINPIQNTIEKVIKKQSIEERQQKHGYTENNNERDKILNQFEDQSKQNYDQIMDQYANQIQELNSTIQQRQNEQSYMQIEQGSQFVQEEEYFNQSRYDIYRQSLYYQEGQIEDEDDNYILMDPEVQAKFNKRLTTIHQIIQQKKNGTFQEGESDQKLSIYEEGEILDQEDIEIARCILKDKLLKRDEHLMMVTNKQFADNCDKFAEQFENKQVVEMNNAIDYQSREESLLQIKDFQRYNVVYKPILSLYDNFQQPDMKQMIQTIFEYLRDNVTYDNEGPGVLFSFVDRHVQKWYQMYDTQTNGFTYITYAQVFRALIHVANKVNLKLIQRRDDNAKDFIIFLARGQKRLDQIEFLISNDDDL